MQKIEYIGWCLQGMIAKKTRIKVRYIDICDDHYKAGLPTAQAASEGGLSMEAIEETLK